MRIHAGRQTSNQIDRDKQAGGRTNTPALIHDEPGGNDPRNSEHGEGGLWPANDRRRLGAGDGGGRQADRAPPSYPAEDPVPKINERGEPRKQAI